MIHAKVLAQKEPAAQGKIQRLKSKDHECARGAHMGVSSQNKFVGQIEPNETTEKQHDCEQWSWQTRLGKCDPQKEKAKTSHAGFEGIHPLGVNSA